MTTPHELTNQTTKALAAALNGSLSTAAAAEQAQADLEEIAQTIN